MWQPGDGKNRLETEHSSLGWSGNRLPIPEQPGKATQSCPGGETPPGLAHLFHQPPLTFKRSCHSRSFPNALSTFLHTSNECAQRQCKPSVSRRGQIQSLSQESIRLVRYPVIIRCVWDRPGTQEEVHLSKACCEDAMIV